MVYVILAVLGLIFGSFASATVWRLHEQAALVGKKGTKTAARKQQLSITKGRSMCAHCGHELAAKDLIPLVSWLWLKGRCRYCHKKIDDSPLTEIVMASLFVISYVLWPLSLSGGYAVAFCLWLVFVVLGVMLAVYDLRWFLLPDKLVLPLTIVAVAYVLTLVYLSGVVSTLIAPVIGAVIIGGLFYALFQGSKGEWIGGGDVKMAPALGLLAGGPLEACLLLFLASLLGTILSLPQFIKGGRSMKMRIPFGPFLLIATFIIGLLGSKIADFLLYR
ncbi:MAG: putative Prepilin peptidase [Candidatus Saccharibacteria bacterium]|nr:putative Prepilin peptidase [Candidatus Saccharibacteria bacterium]